MKKSTILLAIFLAGLSTIGICSIARAEFDIGVSAEHSGILIPQTLSPKPDGIIRPTSQSKKGQKVQLQTASKKKTPQLKTITRHRAVIPMNTVQINPMPEN